MFVINDWNSKRGIQASHLPIPLSSSIDIRWRWVATQAVKNRSDATRFIRGLPFQLHGAWWGKKFKRSAQ